VLTGQRGAGKTHLLAWVREHVQEAGGYFFLLELVPGKSFWRNVVHTLISGLQRPSPDGRDQLTVLLDRLCARVGVDENVWAAITGVLPVTRSALDEFVAALRQTDPRLGRESQYTLRALAMLRSANADAQDIAEGFLISQDEAEPDEWSAWGRRPQSKSPAEIVTELSWLLGLTGPIVLAVDQVDTLIAQNTERADPSNPAPATVGAQERAADRERGLLAEEIGDGLMELREKTRRTLIVVSCLVRTWELIQQRAVDSVADRFHADRRLERIPSPETALELVSARFAPRFASVEFTPPYPTWPVHPDALADAPRFTPRGLMKRIDVHVRNCLRAGEVRTLSRLEEDSGEETLPPPELAEVAVDAGLSARLDEVFDSLKKRADTGEAVVSGTEDVAMPPLLSAGLRAWILEQGPEGAAYSLDHGQGRRPAWHARLHQTLGESSADEIHWVFRSIAGPHHNAVKTRVERVQTLSGLTPEVQKRKVFVLRTGEWKVGDKTRQRVREFEDAGGVILPAEREDLSVFWALHVMLEEHKGPSFSAWLRLRQPASRTRLLTEAFGPPGPPTTWPPEDDTGPHQGPDRAPDEPTENGEPPTGPGSPPAVSAPPSEASPATAFPLGATVSDEAANVPGPSMKVPLESLRKHVVIFAGSGSGKTVLLRRIVEECALRGVSSIVLDPNNDLARLGAAWPQPPAGWGEGDAARAHTYLDGTEVVVWTPRRDTGRPLSFQPLPDFAAVFDDADEFALALDTAVSALAPRARVGGATARAERGRAVLRESLAYFARRGGSGLNAFIDLLADLPDGVTPLTKAPEIAGDLAQTLMAAMINDPMFGGSGIPLEPGALLTPSPGRRARVSVISFIGLPDNEQRQSFVNQLQMALFAWIKRHPAGDRPLGGLFVMDEAQTLAPSGAMTACTESTLALVSQARKYGLGLVFATQAPKGIHNRIAGNAATQFFGFLNSPVQVAAAKEMAAAKASGVADISRLSSGQFYAVGEGLAFRKVVMPMCLSYHPPSALSAEDVLALARDS
jgi:hypothetical protein